MAAEQLDLLTMARATDPTPSHDAARQAAGRAPSARSRVLGALRRIHDGAHLGATADEVHGLLEVTGDRMQRNSVSKRLGELADRGLVETAAFRRQSPSGVMVTVYLPADDRSPP
jgi:Fe2+ or Zn2+ uptake regulation protein